MRLLTAIYLLALLGCEAKVPQISTASIESIVLSIYKNDLMRIEENFDLSIPKDDWSSILDFTLPNELTHTGPNPLRIATVRIKYKDKKSCSIDVFWMGKNPCMVSLDGKNFYYAKNIPGAADGGSGLIRKVRAIRSQREQEEQKHNSKK